VGVTSHRTWKNLEESFGTPGPAIIYANFKKAISFKLTGGNPALEIATLFTLFAHLKVNKAELSEFYQVMLLIEALPAKWDLLASAYMHENTKVEDYKFINFCNAMCAKWERQSGKKVPHHTNKLSAVKWKGKSPHFKDQKQKSDKQKANDQGDDNHDRKCLYKCGNWKGKGKAADTDHQHSHLASSSVMPVVETPPSVPTPSQIYLRPTDVLVRANTKTVVATHHPDRIFYQPLNHASAQSFTGKPNKPSNPYPGIQRARDLADWIRMTKNLLNLKALENIKSYHKFVKSTPIYQNAVAFSSSAQVKDVPAPKPSIVDRMSLPQPKDFAWYEKRCRENICQTQQQNKKVPLTPAIVVSEGDEPSDWGTDNGAFQVEASVDNDIAKVAGFSNPVNHFDDEDPNDYEDPNFYRQVNLLTITQEEFNSLHKQLQILVATVDSLSLDCNNKNIFFACNSSNCVNCKNKKLNNLTFLGESGASQTFTSEISDFSTYEKITHSLQVQTADKKTVMHVVGKETVFITHEVETDSGEIST
jgi:gag-polypeptide of LTR copia-type